MNWLGKLQKKVFFSQAKIQIFFIQMTLKQKKRVVHCTVAQYNKKSTHNKICYFFKASKIYDKKSKEHLYFLHFIENSC